MTDAQSNPRGSSKTDGNQPQVTYHDPNFVSTSIGHPRLVRTESAFIRKFLGRYDQYCKEITTRALQLAVVDATTTEPVRPVNLTYCVDPEWLRSIVDLNLIPDFTDYEMVKDEILRTFLEERSRTTTTTISLSAVNSIIDKELKMDMADTSAPMRMKNRFASYLSVLRRHGLQWITKSRPKTAITHVIAAVKPKSLRTKLESNIDFSHMELQKDFNAFFKHAVKISESFDDVDTGPIARSSFTRHRREVKAPSSGNSIGSRETPNASNEQWKSRSRSRPLPLCPHLFCKRRKARHWIDDCDRCSEEEKLELKA